MKKPPQKGNKLVVGVTGGIACGKSTVARMLVRPGIALIDADRVSRAIISVGEPAYNRLVKAFGREILYKNGRINRRELSVRAFSSKESRSLLNRITHPHITAFIRSAVSKSPGPLVIDAPLLLETGLERLTDYLVVVKCRRETQIERALERGGMDRWRVLRIIRAQMPSSKKEGRADFIIDNNGTKTQTRKQVVKLRRKLWRNWI